MFLFSSIKQFHVFSVLIVLFRIPCLQTVQRFWFDHLTNEEVTIYTDYRVSYKLSDMAMRNNFVSIRQLEKENKMNNSKLEPRSYSSFNVGIITGVNNFWKLLEKATICKSGSKWIIIVEFTDDLQESHRARFNITKFKSELVKNLSNSTFYQQNFLVIQMIFVGIPDRCLNLVAYRIDTIASPVIIREIPNSAIKLSSTMPLPVLEIWKESRADFDGTELNVVGVDLPFYIYNTKFKHGDKDQVEFESGFAVEMLFGMRDMLNFRIKAQATDTWGTKAVNGTSWIGQIGDVSNGKSDIGISCMAAVGPRIGVVDYNVACSLVRVSAFFKRPSGLDINSDCILLPFSSSLWISLGIWIVFNYCCYKVLQSRFTEEDFSLCTIDDCMSRLQVFTSVICSTGLWISPKRVSTRALYLSELIIMVILSSAYSGILISYLSLENNPIKNMDNLLASGYRIFILRNPAARHFLQFSPDPTKRELYKRNEETERFTKYGDHADETFQTALFDGNFAFISDHLTMSTIRNSSKYLNQSCGMHEMLIDGGIIRMGPIVRKKSKIKKIVDYSIIKMRETGNIDLWTQRNFMFLPKCDQQSYVSWRDGVNLRDIFLLYKILGTAFLLGPLVLIFELIHSRMLTMSILFLN